MSRLPTVAGDNDGWGSVLNDFLSVAHNADGTLISGSSTALGWIDVKAAYGAAGDGVTNDTTAINNAITALAAGGTLYFPPGRYMTNGGHVINTPSVRIIGPSGRAQTYNSSAQLYLRNGANADMLRLATNQITVRDLSLYGNFANQSATSRGIVSTSSDGPNYFVLDTVWVDSFKGDGISIDSAGTVSGQIINSEMRVNQGYGLKALSGATDLQVRGGYIDQNLQSGVHCASGDLSLLDVHIWGNGTGSTGDLDGITFQSSAGCRVMNCYIETQHNGAGIRFKTGTNKGHIVTGCDIWDNASQGIYAFDATYCTFTGNAIRSNNFNGSAGSGGAGLALDGACTAITVTGNNFLPVGANRQTYGIYVIGSSCVDCWVSGNMSRAADHTTGGVSLGPGVRGDLMDTGTPEGVIPAAVGSTYRRTNGGAGTSFYIKESGTGNTGWIGK